MTQFQTILAHLKTIIENQDKILIFMNKVVKFLEQFKPLIDWVSLFLIYQRYLKSIVAQYCKLGNAHHLYQK